eukprot:1049343-Alexandrium_andersonii.AAC.1
MCGEGVLLWAKAGLPGGCAMFPCLARACARRLRKCAMRTDGDIQHTPTDSWLDDDESGTVDKVTDTADAEQQKPKRTKRKTWSMLGK